MYKLDHIVHFVENPLQAMEDLKQQGLHIVEGGKHHQWGTYNALSYFGLSYIELIGIFDHDIFNEAAKVPYTLHEKYKQNDKKNGLTKIAIRTETIKNDADKLSAAGFDVIGPQRFSRTRPDGSVVSWQLLHIGHPSSNITYPFFIQWDTLDHERMEELQQQGIMATHPAGDLVMEEVAVVVPHFEIFDSIYRALDVDMSLTYDDIAETEIASLHFEGGDIVFYLAEEENARHYEIQHVKFANAHEEKIIQYDGATYIFTK